VGDCVDRNRDADVSGDRHGNYSNRIFRDHQDCD
jgi:hypothetical protein